MQRPARGVPGAGPCAAARQRRAPAAGRRAARRRKFSRASTSARRSAATSRPSSPTRSCRIRSCATSRSGRRRSRSRAAVMFADMRGFTAISEQLTPGRSRRAAQRVLRAADRHHVRVRRHGLQHGRRQPHGRIRRAGRAGGRQRSARSPRRAAMLDEFAALADRWNASATRSRPGWASASTSAKSSPATSARPRT